MDEYKILHLSAQEVAELERALDVPNQPPALQLLLRRLRASEPNQAEEDTAARGYNRDQVRLRGGAPSEVCGIRGRVIGRLTGPLIDASWGIWKP